jgi:microcystin-dependent protein
MSDPFLGEIKMVGFNYAPVGYAQCNGAILAISTNSALFALLGTMYGGNGVNTFGLPNYCSRSPVGMGQGPGLSNITQGEMSGTENVTILTTQMPIHTHAAQAAIAIPGVEASTNVVGAPANNTSLGPVAAAGRAGTLYSTDAPTTTLAPFNANVTVGTAGGSQPVPIRNPYLGTNFIIALEGIFPSRP